jgi:chromosome segregation ATPase
MDEKTIAMLAELQAKLAEKEKELAELKAQVDELTKQADGAEKKAEEAEKKVAETETNFAKYRNDIAIAQRTSRIDALVTSGKVMPAEREKHLQMATALSSASTVNFATVGGHITAEEQYLRDLEARNTSLLFGEFHAPGVNEQAVNTADMVKGL